ncbi:MAG TPA: response regulator [Anaerolineales bacterium]|nr:response regulator [Anaerolineales bacterium]HNK64487.1 response regulator [Anaerolineales bacterium]HNN12586.1 response regulator [Anaerolineales bacterium]HNO31309.1 response regulator [Anaerolineales bacterium]
MERRILLVDDHRDILRLLHATLDTLKNKDLKIMEAPSGEEALLESTRHKVDLLVTDYKLPGMSGLELMHKIRARHPEAKVILITGVTDKKTREEIFNAGALAIFDKPISMADFLDAVERGLGLVQTIFPTEKPGPQVEERHSRVSDLLANFRQDIKADAVFLLNDRGLVQARTGDLRDPSMEVSLISTLMAFHAPSLKVARINHQEMLNLYHVFRGGDHDMLFIPVTPQYALLVAGNGLAAEDRAADTLHSLFALRDQMEKALKFMGVAEELSATSNVLTVPVSKVLAEKLAQASPAPEMEALLKQANAGKGQPQNADDFWSEAAEKHANKPASPEVISFDEARKMGILPDDK